MIFDKLIKPHTLSQVTLHHEVNIFGNIFRFNIPDNFSRDMPAEELIEHLDVKNSPSLHNQGFVILMQRWWDLKEPGFFGKEQGAVMMSISVRTRPKNQAAIIKTDKYDFHDFLQFIVALNDNLDPRYREHNAETMTSGNSRFSVYVPPLVIKTGETPYPNYNNFFHNRTWITTETGIYTTGQINKIYATPLNSDYFLEIEFSLMPNENIVAREFINLAKKWVNSIADTFILHYASGNEFDEITSSSWANKTLLDELHSHNVRLFDDTDEPRQIENDLK